MRTKAASKGAAQEPKLYYWRPAYPSNQERLKWSIEFIQLDLSALDPGKLFETLFQMEKYLFLQELSHNQWERDPFPQLIAQLPISQEPVDISNMLNQTNLTEMADIQQKMKRFFLEYVWPVIEINQKGFSLSGKIEKIPKPKRRDEDYQPLAKLITNNKGNFVKDYRFSATFSMIFVDPCRQILRVEDAPSVFRETRAVLELKRLITELPLYAIRKCEECQRLFYNPTKKKRMFCSSKCSWRFNARKKREKNPEAYKKKQREIMWQRYEDQVKKEIGENVTVKRRKHYKIRRKKKGGNE
jgi:hypothetical protein